MNNQIFKKDQIMNENPFAWFSINLSNQAGSLERLLGRIRRRGFQLENMMVTNSSIVDGYRIEIRVHGNRSFKTLAKHIANMSDVLMVSLHVAESSYDCQPNAVPA